MTPARNSKQFPDYGDVRAFHDALLRANPDRLIWGSDWPYLRMGEATPDAGHLLDLLDEWSGDETLRRKILADNPARLYGLPGIRRPLYSLRPVTLRAAASPGKPATGCV